MAECYQKLGDAEARKIYERVVREYSDQKEAAGIARARLGGADVAARATGDRAVWTGPMVDLFGQVSPDGRFITFVDWANSGNLMVHDLVTNTDRRITQKTSWKESGYAGWSAISRDGKQIAYAWEDKAPPDRLLTIRITLLQDVEHRQTRQLLVASPEIDFISPYDWSPDTKWIAVVAENRKEGTFQIGVVGVPDGSWRVLKTVSWPGPTKLFFSGDSKYIAYDHPVSDDSDQRDVFVLAIDGSRETPVVVHPAQDKVLGWAPDGKRLLFASDRTGSMCLWSQQLIDGRTVGTPDLLKADIGSGVIFPLGITSSGALYLYKSVGDRDVRIASIDVNAEKPVGPATNFVQGFLPGIGDSPDWSPDGKYLVYPACGHECLAIRSVETGQVRRLPAKLGYIRDPRWNPDGRSVLSAGTDFKGRWGIFQVDAQTGDVTILISTGNIGTGLPRWSPDGRKIYYLRVDGDVRTFFERDLVSGADRIISRHNHFPEMELSPDGRQFAGTGRDLSANASTLALFPVDGSEPRELLRLTEPETFPTNARALAWTSDGQAVVVAKITGVRTELWLVPISSGQPRKLNVDVGSWSLGDTTSQPPAGFSLSRDGRRIAFLTGKSANEVWALENFLPAPRSSDR